MVLLRQQTADGRRQTADGRRPVIFVENYNNCDYFYKF